MQYVWICGSDYTSRVSLVLSFSSFFKFCPCASQWTQTFSATFYCFSEPWNWCDTYCSFFFFGERVMPRCVGGRRRERRSDWVLWLSKQSFASSPCLSFPLATIVLAMNCYGCSTTIFRHCRVQCSFWNVLLISSEVGLNDFEASGTATSCENNVSLKKLSLCF